MNRFWSKSAEAFVNTSAVIGYELINEPFAGDFFQVSHDGVRKGSSHFEITGFAFVS